MALIVLLASCQSSKPMPLAASHLPTEKEPTILLPFPSSVPTISSNTPIRVTTTPKAKSGCEQLVEKPLSRVQLNGQLVLHPLQTPTYLLALNTMQTKTPVSEDTHYLATSPDGKWLAYNTYPPRQKLYLQSADGKQKLQVPVAWQGFFKVSSWLSNQKLVLLLSEENIVKTLVINPFTGQWSEYNLREFKNAANTGNGGLFFASSNLMPDPLEQFVVYPQSVDLVTLWDIKNQKALATINDHGGFHHDPLWDQDGANFVIAIGVQGGYKISMQNWFFVTKQGEISQLTHLEDAFDYVLIRGESRSPDGKKVAFWLTSQPNEPYQGQWVVINLDIPTRLLCTDGPTIGTFYPAVWSPDSRYVVVTDFLSSDQIGPVDLIDTQEKWITKVAQDASVFGWLNQP